MAESDTEKSETLDPRQLKKKAVAEIEEVFLSAVDNLIDLEENKLKRSKEGKFIDEFPEGTFLDEILKLGIPDSIIVFF
jgi:hypothetical protein